MWWRVSERSRDVAARLPIGIAKVGLVIALAAQKAMPATTLTMNFGMM
jgi:hypothetical protein